MADQELQRSMPTHREAIHRAAERLFGRSLEIEERAYQALAIVRPNGNAALPQDVWWSATARLPAITRLYDALGIKLSSPSPDRQKWIPASSYGEPILDSTWSLTLVSVFFHHVGREPVYPTLGARMVLADGRLTIESLILGMLESTQIRRKEGRDPRRITNLAFRRLARS